MKKTESFDSALYGVSNRIRRVLEFIPDDVKSKTDEIRIRCGLPVSLTVKGTPLYVLKGGQLCDYISSDILKASKEDLNESFLLLCNNSVYAHGAELKCGYITMSSGHRAGICGTLTEQGNLRDISSINIRIAREVKGCADTLLPHFDGNGFLIAGPPGSGKTTMLRDFIRQLSSGFKGQFKRISVIDSRGELSGSYLGKSYTDLGENTDILLIKDKAAGTEIAVRTLFPQIIAFDEIGTAAELKGVAESFHAGVSVITTAHAGSIKDIMERSVTSALINSGAISKIALLSETVGEGIMIIDVKELLKNDVV